MGPDRLLGRGPFVLYRQSASPNFDTKSEEKIFAGKEKNRRFGLLLSWGGAQQEGGP
jgi:hypothetical protein